jgi:hypothetical protein
MTSHIGYVSLGPLTRISYNPNPDQFGRAIDGLVNRGLGAYLEEMLKDEREDLNCQIRLLEALMRKSKELEAA